MTTIRTVLITGGNRGIGYSLAEEFIAQGHRVAVILANAGNAGGTQLSTGALKPGGVVAIPGATPPRDVGGRPE
jgi:NAD(P)-dependent dehydrogenase (short-subunit alcohol dehydrogenase family)